ncbi:MAG TPA: amino acid adenylation domain-containing protein [Herpetosiphonaceae bacterium]
MSEHDLALTGIAIIGMSGRFPGASSVEAFWQNLRAGVESVQFFSDEDVLAAGVNPAQLGDPSYVKARAVFDGAELFDAGFFGYNPREAAIMDPQQRLFLECAWESLEHAGYDSSTYPGLIGVFGGASMNTYLLANLYPNRDLIGLIGDFQSMIGNDKDYLTTRVSYKLDLKGPAVTVQTACSTSLVAVCLACQSLLQYQCDMALAGGSSIGVPQRGGYLYQEGGIGSPDGHCRAFDAAARGTVGGDGVGVVVLKRLEDALADGDTIHGVITGFAINNDGAIKAGYTAPSVEGQAQVIEAAQAMADVDPETIGYIETHGTATPIGDPIEIAALTQVFRARTDKTGFCAIGSVKTNIGHLNAAAGVAGLIKTVLALGHKRIPPSLHFTQPNPQIDFANSPFVVNSRLSPWTARGGPRRAGVSSFGIGGTNAHVVVEEAPQPEPSGPSRPWQLLPLSARSAAALEAATDNLAAYLEQDANLADVAYTLQVGRRAFGYRRVLLCRDLDDARRALASGRGRLLTRFQEDQQRPVAFLFPGGGAQHLAMAADLYQHEPTFRQEIDRCVELLKPQLGLDLRQVLYPQPGQSEAARELRQTALALPALFMVEYALAQLWISWGVRPSFMIGHSLGEYVAACLAGVFSLEDALALVVLRGRLMQQLQPGAMLSVAASPEEIQPFLNAAATDHLALAAINGPALCVVSGTAESIAALETTLSQRGLNVRQLHIDVAAHSALVEPILGTFTSFVRTLRLQAPRLPYLSNVTGTWATAADATDPQYWARHLRQTVRFGDGLQTLLAEPDLALLEVGPSQSLTTLAKAQATSDRIVLASMRHPNDQQPDDAFLLSTLGQLWLAGVTVDWAGYSAHERRRRLPLPTYPFERQRYWIDPPGAAATGSHDRGELLHIPSAVPAALPAAWEQAALHPRPHLPNEYIAPRSDLEQLIAGVWQNLLGIEPIGVEDNFFALGGHSLLATQIVARVSEVCRVELPLRSLFETPTIAGLAEQVALASAEAQPPAAPPIPPIPREAPLPLSFAQQRLWFVDQLAQGMSAYNMPAAVRLRGRLDAPALERALAEVVRRHEILRTTFALLGGQPVQRVAPAGSAALHLADLRDLPPEEREAEAKRLATIEAQQPFDLEAGPLLRSRLMRLQDDEHVLMLAMHHIIADEWSLGVLIRELTTLYAAFSQGQPSPLPELPIQYADFAAWQRAWLAPGAPGGVLEEQLSYWQRHLADAPVLQLPTDRPRSPVGTFRGTNQTFTLPLELADRLRDLSQRAGCTLFMTLLAAFQTLLSRYSGQSDIVVSSGVANRRRPELETLIGCFINILVLRVDLADRPRFRDLLGRVREICLEAYAHQDLPFELLVERLHPERDLSYNPLAQVMFIVQNAPVEIHDLPDLTVEPVVLFERAAAQFDLTMHVWEQPDGLRGIVEYNTDLFDAATIARMLGHFRVLLEAIVADPDRRTSELPLLTTAERYQMIVEWNATQTAFPADRCLHELFEAHVTRDPGAVALIVDEWQPQTTPGIQRMTYGDLNQRADRLAAHLRALGVGPDVPVGLYVERSAEMVIGILGILKAGGAYVPLDPDYPRERLAAMVRDARMPVLVTQSRLDAGIFQASASQQAPVVVYLDRSLPPVDPQPRQQPAVATTPEHLAYVIYTSGSTGRPKGIAIRHRGVLNNIVDLNERFDVGPADRVLALSSISFDMSVYEVLGTLAAGATIVMPAMQVSREPECWADLLVRHQVTVWNSAPPLLKILVDHVADRPPQHPRWLRLAILGGDWVPVTLPDRLKAIAPDVRVISLGGATEASIHSTIFPVDVRDPGWRSIPYGWPMANQRIYVLDANLQPVPIGVPGELHLGGIGLARGYFNRPDLTAAKFIPNPFIGDDPSLDPSDRIYKTGDQVRYLPDGNTELLGRIDHLVKIRGFRIELGEIKAVLERHPSVREAVVVVREDQPSTGGHPQKRLVAYVVAQRNNGTTEQRNNATGDSELETRSLEPGTWNLELRAYLKEQLPDYMVPSAFVFLDALPLSPNGKVDRKALPAPQPETNERAEVLAAPRTPIEELLAGIWADVLGMERVGIHDNFFELGGHSLLATQVLSRVRAAIDVTLPLRELFEAPTVAGMAARVAAARQVWNPPPLRPAAREDAIPLSFAQQRLWFLDQLQPHSPFYNVPLAVRLSGQLDRAGLEQSLSAVLRRHEALRTTFSEVAGAPRQVIAPAATIDLTVVDLRGLPAFEREQEARRLAAIEARRPFDLQHGPLLHAALLRLDDAEHVLILTLHHIVADGWSLGVLLREMAALYQAQIDGTAPALPDLPVQYADYAIWQRTWLRGEVLEAQLGYWRGKLAGAPSALDLPTDRPRPAVQTFNGAIHTFTLPAELSTALSALSQREGVTLFMTLLAAFQTVLSRYSGQTDIVVGSPIAGRAQPEVEGLIGCFINTMVLRADLSGRPTFRALLGQVREACLDAYAHQDLPFELLVEALHPDRDLSHHPLIQVLFALQNAPIPELSVPGLTLQPLEVSSGTARLDLALSMTETVGGLAGTLEYNTDLFEAATIARLAGHIQTLLESVVADPDRRVTDLRLLTAADHAQLRAWHAPNLSLPSALVPQRLVDQARRTPQAPALVCGSATLTYAELLGRSNQLAHHLRALGVGGCPPGETRVAVLLPRGLDLVVSLLAVWQAGGAYVPLDARYPAERLAFVLADSAPTVLLTDSGLLAAMPAPATQVVCLDAAWPEIARQPETSPVVSRQPEQLAYLIYTSGTTGQPKAVMVEHRQLATMLAGSAHSFGFAATDTMPWIASVAFDISLLEVFSMLLVGGTTRIVTQEQVLDLPLLVDGLARCTVLHAVPSLMQQVVATLDEQPEWAARCQGLRLIYTGGDAVPPELLTGLQRLFPQATVCVLYGPTETTVIATSYTVPRSMAVSGHIIGRALPNVRLRIVDRYGSEVPIGAAGELQIGGPQVTRGYWRRPALTAEKYHAADEQRWYRTGDLARYRADGVIEYLGRIDTQVKIHGFRIEPGEIEAVLRQHESVAEAVVVARADNGGEKRLVAYVVEQGNTRTGEGLHPKLRAYLKDRLPEYMVPSVFVILDALPLSPNGKLDRNALPAPGDVRLQLGAEFVAPRTAIEAQLARIWAEVLGVERVGVFDNFFELGGHSLLAAQVVSRVRSAFGPRMTLRTLFETPTVAGIAEALSGSPSEQTDAPEDDIPLVARGDQSLDQLLAELEQLPDEAITALLASERQAIDETSPQEMS